MSMMDFSGIPPLNAELILRKHGLRPHKSLGQNFLQDPFFLSLIVKTAGISREDHVLEIGAGLGSLSRYLASVCHSVTTVELDSRLLPLLKEVLNAYTNVRIVHGDVLQLPPESLMESSNYIVVANIPYNITSAIIRHLLEARVKPRRVILTIQREVAERICASPGQLSLLALSVQVYGRPQVVSRIPASAFYPSPAVDSAILQVEIFDEPVISSHLIDLYFKLIKAGFGQKRKTLRNSLSSGLGIPPTKAEALLAKTDIDPKRRAETLNIREWERLCISYSKDFSNSR